MSSWYTRIVSGLLLALVPLGLAACGSSSSSSGTPSRHPGMKVLSLDYFAGANGALATTLDPALVTSASAADTIALTNANLVKILPNNKVAPDLATWTVDKNHLVYTFTIRKNARFANGHRVTAADAAYSIRRSLAPSTASPVALTYLGLIKGAQAYNAGKSSQLPGVRVLGPRTLQISITKPVAYFLLTLSYPTADVLDPAVVRGKTASSTGNFLTSSCPGNQGAGPFKFVCSGSRFYPAGRTPSYTLAPNSYYYGPKPHIRLNIPAVNTIDTSYKMYLAGGIDMTQIPTPDISKWMGKTSQYVQYPTSIVTYLTPNTRTPPFSDVHCRLAVAYAINRETIARNVLRDSVRPDYVVLPKGFLGYYDGSKSEPHYNPARARQELQQCAYRSTPVRLTYPTTSSDADNTYTAIAAMLNQVGFHASTNAISANDWATVVSSPLTKTNTQLVRNGWQQDFPDPEDYLTVLLRSGSTYDIGGWTNARFDSLVDRAAVEQNPSQRAALYRHAQHIALGQGAWIALFNTVGHQLVKPNVHGLVGTTAYGDLVPRNLDWSQVSVT